MRALNICSTFVFALGVWSQQSYAAELSGCTLVKPPTNPTELMNNLVCVAKNSPNLDEKFFIDDERLWEVTSGQKFYRTYPLPPKTTGTYVQYLATDVDSSGLDAIPFEQRLCIDFIKKTEPFKVEIMAAYVYGNHKHGMNLHFADIEKIFGTNWKDPAPQPFYIPEPFNSPPPAATDPHGYKEIEYDLPIPTDTSKHGKILVNFDKDGLFANLKISVEDIVKSEPQGNPNIPPPALPEISVTRPLTIKTDTPTGADQ